MKKGLAVVCGVVFGVVTFSVGSTTVFCNPAGSEACRSNDMFTAAGAGTGGGETGGAGTPGAGSPQSVDEPTALSSVFTTPQDEDYASAAVNVQVSFAGGWGADDGGYLAFSDRYPIPDVEGDPWFVAATYCCSPYEDDAWSSGATPTTFSPPTARKSAELYFEAYGLPVDTAVAYALDFIPNAGTAVEWILPGKFVPGGNASSYADWNQAFGGFVVDSADPANYQVSDVVFGARVIDVAGTMRFQVIVDGAILHDDLADVAQGTYTTAPEMVNVKLDRNGTPGDYSDDTLLVDFVGAIEGDGVVTGGYTEVAVPTPQNAKWVTHYNAKVVGLDIAWDDVSIMTRDSFVY